MKRPCLDQLRLPFLPGDFAPRFSVDLLAKDLGLATDTAKQQGVRLLLGTVAELLVREAQADGEGANDMAAVIRPLERRAGVDVGSRAGEAAS